MSHERDDDRRRHDAGMCCGALGHCPGCDRMYEEQQQHHEWQRWEAEQAEMRAAAEDAR